MSGENRGVVVSGDGGYDRFFDAQKRALVGQAFLLTNDMEEAKDLAQEALMRAWRQWDRVSSLEDPPAWVRHVLHNLAVGRWRRAATRKRHAGKMSGQADTVPEIDPVAVDVAAAMRTLPPRLRQVLVLKAVVGMTTAEIADELGASEGSVRVWLSRARAGFLVAYERDERAVGGGAR